MIQTAIVSYAPSIGNGYVVDQTSSISAFKMAFKLSLTINNAEVHSIVGSRILSQSVASVLSVTQMPTNGIVKVLLTVKSVNRGTCNEPLNHFTTQYNFDNKFYIADFGPATIVSLLPNFFGSSSLNITAKIITNCGPVVSNTVHFLDSTQLQFSSSLALYVSNLLLNIGSIPKDQVNNLNMIMIHITTGYQRCKAENICLAPLSDYITQAEAVLSRLPLSLDDNKYSMTARYSFINSFFLEANNMTSDASTRTLVDSLTSTVTYLKNKMNPFLTLNHRFSRALRMGLSSLDILQPDLLDYPIKLTTNMLSYSLFSYQSDKDRNNLLNSTISRIVDFGEIKMIRSSSNKREEVYEDDVILMKTVTVLSPLESIYTIDFNNDTKLVFKNLRFAEEAQYYEIIVLNWKSAFIEKMKPIYNSSTNGFILKNFFFDFRNYFVSQPPIAGEGQIMKRTCENEISESCSITLSPQFKVCTCFKLNISSGVIPSVTSLDKSPYSLVNDVDGLFNNPNSEKLDFKTLNNFSAWCYSTMGIYLVLTGLFVTGIVLVKYLTIISGMFAQNLGTQILINKIFQSIERTTPSTLKKQKQQGNDSKPSEPKDQNVDNDDDFSSSWSKGSDSLSSNNKLIRLKLQKLMKGQQDNYAEVTNEEAIDIELAEKLKFEGIGFRPFYLKYLMMNHTSFSIIFLKSTQYSKITMLSLTYLRMATHLAISMYFTMGILFDNLRNKF